MFSRPARIDRQSGKLRANREQCRDAGRGIVGFELGDRIVGEFRDVRAAGKTREGRIDPAEDVIRRGLAVDHG